MAWYENFIQYVIPIISIIGAIIVSFVKNKKVKRYAYNILNVTEVAKTYIKEAEKMTNYTGAEKKNFVMSRLLKYLFDNTIKKVSEQTLSDIVENELSLTNEVNIEKKMTYSKPSMNIISEPNEMPHTLKE